MRFSTTSGVTRRGVDDYLTKKIPDVELHARIHAAFNTAALRRSLKEAQAALAALEKPQARPAKPAELAGEPAGSSSVSRDDLGSTTHIMALPLMQAPKVLLVDDDEILMERLSIPMIDAGYEVVTATSGSEALAALQRDFMSIVILDRDMPGMDGLELCRRIRRHSWPGYVYLMLLTAHDTEDDVLLGLKAGADDYLSKRVSDAHLVARLSTAARVLSLEFSLKSALEERRRMAMTDALTGAHNRRYFMRYLGGELKRAKRFGTELSLLMLDIDHFKRVNDEFGHAAGDVVLQKFVKRLQKGLPRDYEWCARLGGEGVRGGAAANGSRGRDGGGRAAAQVGGGISAAHESGCAAHHREHRYQRTGSICESRYGHGGSPPWPRRSAVVHEQGRRPEPRHDSAAEERLPLREAA